MFKRLKNWILNRPAEDHALASFAWFGGAYLATGAAMAFPVLTPIAAGVAVLATKAGILEGIIAGAHVVNNVLSWGFKKLFGSSEKSIPTKNETATSTPKENEKTNQKAEEKNQTTETSKTAGKDSPEMVQKPTSSIPKKQETLSEATPKQPTIAEKPQIVQIPATELKALIQEMKQLSMQIKQMKQEIAALRLENQNLKRQNEMIKKRIPARRPERPQIRMHRHYIQNGRLMHE